MNNEHNPIARLITQLQESWNDLIVPNTHVNLVRWMMDTDEAKLYEGLLKIESSEHGKIPDMTVTLLTPFKDINSHSKTLVENWIEIYKANRPEGLAWEPEEFEKRLKREDGSQLLLDVLTSFQSKLADQDNIVTLCLYPFSINNQSEYSKWIERFVKLNNSEKVRLMVFDYRDQNFMNHLFSLFHKNAATLDVDLDLKGAIHKINSAGDPNDPTFKLRQCIMNMSKAAAEKNKKGVKKWGERGLEVSQKSGEKISFATAHVFYAANLFGFKTYKEIDELLNNGLTIAKQGVKMGDDGCKVLVIQAYGILASSQQLQKNKSEAITLYCKQADIATEYELAQMSLNAYWLAMSLIKNKQSKQFTELVEKAYNTGLTLDEAILKSTAMPYIAYQYYDYLMMIGEKEKYVSVDEFMKKIIGEQWREEYSFERKDMKMKTKQT